MMRPCTAVILTGSPDHLIRLWDEGLRAPKLFADSTDQRNLAVAGMPFAVQTMPSACPMNSTALTKKQEALRALALHLLDERYAFTTVTPETHRRVLANRTRPASSLRDVFGWNLPFDLDWLPPTSRSLMEQADVLEKMDEGMARSRVRFATLDGLPYLHSAFPTVGNNDVFCGPDTSRFVMLVAREVSGGRCLKRVVDVGCGAGAGGLIASRVAHDRFGQAPLVEFIDISEVALQFAEINASVFGTEHAVFRHSDLFCNVPPEVDLIVANPPYLVDAGQRLYRHGGGRFGAELSERIVREGLGLLAPGGKLVLYTGSAIVESHDAFRSAALQSIDPRGYDASYTELDPDVFGEELENATYSGVERIAAVALVVRRLDGHSVHHGGDHENSRLR